jgi:hypothetical protein
MELTVQKLTLLLTLLLTYIPPATTQAPIPNARPMLSCGVENQDLCADKAGGLYKQKSADPQLETAWYHQPALEPEM